MRLGFDLDEVVVDLASEFEIHLESTYGIEWPIDCFIHYGFVECIFSNDEELNARIVADMISIANDIDFQFKAKPIEGAIEVLHKLKKAGHKLYFITSRPKQNQPMTFKWLRKNNVPFDELAVVGQTQPKGTFGRRYSLDMYVDDLHNHLESMLHYKKRWKKGLLLMNKPWNTDYIDGSKFKRVYDWYDILRHVGVANR